MHDGKRNTYKFFKDGMYQTLLPIEEGEASSKKSDPKALLMSGKEYLKQIEDEEVNFSLVFKPKVVFTSIKISDFPIEIQEMLEDHCDIIVEDLPK